MDWLWLAQAETVAKAASDLLTAQDVLPFFQASLALAAGGTVYFFWRWQGAEQRIDGLHASALERAEKMIARLTGAKDGDSNA